ncbi:type II CRISPR RNA-guided endonuclease Cas9 [Hydrogenophaga sp.]|uniref:type II CRISPR RNA-guided endonuclease Cas9 n=1 Tax=Hydrogenophaga sp. TaxID=1904254 RepID=UPI003F6CFA5E
MSMRMRYRLALDLGSTSLGWAMVRLNGDGGPIAVIKAGSRIFSDGRNPKDGSSLAVTRREARAMRRRRDRLLKRKARMMRTLIEHGFFPADDAARKALETINPYSLRAKGLDEALKPEEFARALFHINQRRGFKSNRKTDKKDNDSGALKTAIKQLHAAIDTSGADGKPRTVGEFLHRRDLAGQTVRARYRQQRVEKEDGKTRIDKSYDLYIDRAMIEAEFDALWAKQANLNPHLFNERALAELKDCLLFQRPLTPVKPGRCTLLPDEARAPLALPSQQRFRIYQEVNHLYVLQQSLKEQPLTLEQRNSLVDALERNGKRSFTQIKKLLGLGGAVQFSLEDAKRQELKGNTTSAILSRKEHFGEAWFSFSPEQQDAIAAQLVSEENETRLVRWLMETTAVEEPRAEAIATAALPEGYGSLSAQALTRILPELRRDVITYDKAVLAAGFDHHSHISHAATGEILPSLPYYGEYLQRHVGFGSGKLSDTPEKRFGKIANPTVHIGLNQVRVVVNALIKRYGHPSEVIVEVARDLKQSQEQRKEDNERQAKNQRRNERLRAEAAAILQTVPERVRHADLQKLILWEELSFDPADRRCPYSGVQISAHMVLSDQVEIEHILPFSKTLDDSLNNKTVAMRQANRIKGNRTPWEARDDFEAQGWPVAAMLNRAEQMPKNKRYRFGEEGYQKWLKEDKDFLARALNDTRHLSRVAREYLSLICPQATRVIPGQMTAMLRAKFGLNKILGLDGEKNRNDHRHHAVDACVIAVTDQGMLQRFAQASASTREKQLNRLVEDMPPPWGNNEEKHYLRSVKRAIDAIWVSHKPDHGYEGAMHNDTAYALLGNGMVSVRKTVDGVRQKETAALKVIEFTNAKATARHGALPDGSPRPYKGYKGDSNYCIEIVRNEKGKWEGEVISTFEAYQLVRQHGLARLRHPSLSLSGKPLVMRLINDDIVRLVLDDEPKTLRVAKIAGNGQVFMAPHNEANVDARNRDKSDHFQYVSKMAGSFQKAQTRRISVTPIGELCDPGFKE